jgi:hypothetical protein
MRLWQPDSILNLAGVKETGWILLMGLICLATFAVSSIVYRTFRNWRFWNAGI